MRLQEDGKRAFLTLVYLKKEVYSSISYSQPQLSGFTASLRGFSSRFLSRCEEYIRGRVLTVAGLGDGGALSAVGVGEALGDDLMRILGW